MIWGCDCTTVSGDFHIAMKIYKKEFAMVSVTDGHLKPNPAIRGPQSRFCYWNRFCFSHRSAVANLYTRKWGTFWNYNFEAHLDEKDLPTSDRHWENPYFPGVVFLYEPKTEARICKFWVHQGGLLSNHVRSFIFNTRLRCS